MRHYHSPWDVLDFQAQGVARLYLLHRRLVVWDTGLGKGHLAMAASALLTEDEKIFITLVVAEQTKLDEWEDDYGRFTDLSVGMYHGRNRKRLLEPERRPQVLITTYETARNDASHTVKQGRRQVNHRVEGPLTETLMGLMASTGKGVLVVYDEMSKMRNRTSETFKSHDHMVKRLERPGRESLWVAGLTATPIETKPENGYNEWHILDRTHAPTVEQFLRDHVYFTDDNGRNYYRNIGEGDTMRIPEEPTLAEKMAYLIDRKRKSDPDVKDRFPRMVEDFSPVAMTPEQRSIYDEVQRALDGDEIPGLANIDPGPMFTALRQLVGHPEALLRSDAEGAALIVAHFGIDRILAAGSGKLERLISYLTPILDQGAQAVVYSFYGRSIVPLLAERLEAEGMSFVTHTGAHTKAQKVDARRRFRSGEFRILLSSDAGSKGINLPEATYVCVEADTPILTSDLRWVPARDLRVGDGIVGCDEDQQDGHGRQRARRWRLGEVTKNALRRADCLQVTLSNGDRLVVTPEHRMIVKTGKGDAGWRRADSLRVGWRVMKYLTPWDPALSFEDGWLSGIFDGEGCYSTGGRHRQLVVAQNPGVVLDRLTFLLGETNFKTTTQSGGSSARVKRLHIMGGYAEHMRFLGTYQPVRLVNRWRELVAREKIISAIEYPVVVSVEAVGKRTIAVMETSTRTFMGAGYMHHNCNYELPVAFATYYQRISRASRLSEGVNDTLVTAKSFIVPRTVEGTIAKTVYQRNEWHDMVVDADGNLDPAHTRAVDRIALRQIPSMSLADVEAL